jgi:Uma2 family endonuclease
MVEGLTRAFRTWPAEPRVHRWTKEEYYRAGKAGVFEGRHVELMGGEIVDMSPIGPLHASVVTHVRRVLEQRFPGHHVRDQQPIDAAEDSEPEPDLAVVQGQPLDYAEAHPKRAVLIVEVADWSLAYDRGPKASRYAASGVPDYWVMNLPTRQVEVFRDPRPDATQAFGAGYASHTIATIDDTLTPLAMPNVTIPVRDLFPPTQSKSE